MHAVISYFEVLVGGDNSDLDFVTSWILENALKHDAFRETVNVELLLYSRL